MAPVTAAICTHDRPEKLRRAVRSLVDQRPAASEILVIDNAPSSDETRRIIAHEFEDRVRYVVEDVAGLDFARNRALHESTHDIVAFLDDDAVAADGWIGAIAAAFEDPAVGVCTGRVQALSLAAEGQRIFEANGGYARGDVRVELPRDASKLLLHGRKAPLVAWAFSVGAGASLAVRRRLAIRLGGFDEALDMGAALPGGGDHDMLWRVLRAGSSVVYDPAINAFHEHRPGVNEAYRQIVGHQRALVALLTKMLVSARGREKLPVAAFLLWRLTKPAVRIARRTLGRDPLPARVLLRMWWHCMAGLTAYPRARRLARRRRLQQVRP